jgi:succinoglycan biosynthesis transport protein ExoP
MDEPKTPRIDYLRFLRRIVATRWRMMAIGFLLMAVPAVAGIVLTTDYVYEATATLFLIPERTDPVFMRELMPVEVNSLYIAILRSRSLAQAVTEALPRESREELSNRVVFRDYVLTFTNAIRRLRGEDVIVYSPTEIALRELQQARTSFGFGKDGTVTITATAFSPRVAVDLANTFVDVLLARSSAVARQQNRGTRELLENLLTQARSGQTDADSALRKFQTESGSVIKLPEEARMELARLNHLESAVSELQINREIAEQRLGYLRGQPRPGSPAPGQPLRDRLSQLEARLAALLDRYTDEHPLVQTTRADIRETQDRLRALLQGQQTPRPIGVAILSPAESVQLAKQMADLEVETATMRAREQIYQNRIAAIKRALSALGTKEQEYSSLAHAADSQRGLVGMLSDKLTAARISEQSYLRSMQVIDLATLPHQPSPKQSLKLLMVSLGVAGGVSFGLAALREYTTQVVETEADVINTTGLPVLGSVPVAGGVASTTGAPLNFMTDDPQLALPADACRSVRTTLEMRTLEWPLRTILVTSPGVSEGKSSVLVSLGAAFLETNRRVALVDADLRRAALHRALGLVSHSGLADMLRDGRKSSEAFCSVAPGLECLPSGAKPPNPSALLSSKHVTAVLEVARQRADIVLIDSPPLLAVSDSLRLTARVDGVILVVRAGVTQRRALARAKQQLDKVGARVIGVVVNGLSARDTRRHYAAYRSYVGGAALKKKARRRWRRSR